MEPTPQLGLWKGDFGERYTTRNNYSPDVRLPAFRRMLEGVEGKVLEVGCNRGINLLTLARLGRDLQLHGIEPNRYAVAMARHASLEHCILEGNAFDIPFKDDHFDLVFTAGVLIHIAPEDLHRALAEIVRVSRRYVFFAEYDAQELTEVRYRGHERALWKQDWLAAYRKVAPDLKVVREGLMPQEPGFDRDTRWALLDVSEGKKGGKVSV